jgi:hypothetical protein
METPLQKCGIVKLSNETSALSVFILSALLIFWGPVANASENTGRIYEVFSVNGDPQKVIENIKLLARENFKVVENKKKIFEIYYETPEFHYRNNGGYLRFQAIPYLSKKKKVKYNETVEHLDTGKLPQNYPVKHYDSIRSHEEKHALLGIIRRKSRNDFIEHLALDGIRHPMRIKPIFQVEKDVQELILSRNDEPVIRFIIRTLTTNTSTTALSLLVISNELEVLRDKNVNSVNQQPLGKLVEDIKSTSPLTRTTSAEEYHLLIDGIIETDKMFLIDFEHPALTRLGKAILIAILGFVFIYLFFIRNRRT